MTRPSSKNHKESRLPSTLVTDGAGQLISDVYFEGITVLAGMPIALWGSCSSPGQLPGCPLANQTPRQRPTRRKKIVGPYLTLVEAAAYCRCGKGRFLRWEKRGLIEHVRDPSGRRFYRVEDLDDVMGMGSVTPDPIASTATPRRREITTRGSWLRPTQPRTQPKDPERR